ncbi:MAG: type II toxin-antitoxin system YafQ family toxin [Gammaproteobacteria bacterium]
MYTLEWTPSFSKAAKKFAKQHPELKQKITGVLYALEQDPFQSALRLHALSGNMKGVYAVSITYSYRIILTLKVSDQIITLLDIGDHDAVYR